MVSQRRRAAIKTRIARDRQDAQRQLNEILHDPEFQQLEATWRGLHYLVMNTETSTALKLRVLNVTKKELLKDLEKAAEFDQSALFKKVYEEEYGTSAAIRTAAGRRLRVRPRIRRTSACSRCCRASPRRRTRRSSPAPARSCSTWTASPSSANPRDLAKIFETIELIKWQSFRESEDSRYVALTLPHVLLRLPTARTPMPVEGFNFEEDVDGTRPPQVPVGQRRLGLARGSPTRSPSTAGARRSAASRAAARSRGCRPTPSRPTRATSP